jgi:hypothetical protein
MLRLLSLALSISLITALQAAPASEQVQQARQLEQSGKLLEARTVLARAAHSSSADTDTLLANAEFLDRYGDDGARAAYEKAFESLGNVGSTEQRRMLARRLAVLSFLTNDSQGARRYLAAYREAGGEGMDQANALLQPQPAGPDASWGPATIPGPLFSFRRMAALSTDQAPEELVAALARNIVTSGYRASRGIESLEQTEYLKLILQYLSQARELTEFAGDDKSLDVPACESAETAQLLKILGFRLRNECGPEAVLETVNPSRAFLSIDSGFPLADLELAFRNGQAFKLNYESTSLPVLYGGEYWVAASGKKGKGDFIDVLLSDPAVARLYVAMGKLHGPTASVLKEKIEPARLRNFAHVLDFFGGMFEIRDGKAVVPGGARAEAAWRKIVGAGPEQGAEFFQRLMESDDGWLAAYYDALMRVRGAAAQTYFTDPDRMLRFYGAVRGKVTSPGPARPIFRANAELMLLISRLHFTPNGNAYVPGGIEPWKKLFTEHPHGKYDGKLTRSASGWRDGDDVLEAMFALCRKAVENQPLQMFMAITNLDRYRPTPLQPETVQRIILAFPDHGGQLSLFNDAPNISDAAIIQYLDLLPAFDKMRNQVRRADAVGTFQSLTSLWQVLRRQGQIPETKADASFRELVAAFDNVRRDEAIFDSGRAGVRILLAATGTPESASPQDRLIELLAGTPGPDDQAAHKEVIEKLNLRFGQQRLVSIKDIFDLADHLERVSRGEAFNVAMANRLAARISEVRLPRSNLSTEESTSFAQGHWVEKHIQEQRSLNLRRLVDQAEGRPERLLEIRGELAPILRDSLVGLAYTYYSPPAAELIRANPLFVRSHDFLGSQGFNSWRPSRLLGTGWPNSGGGRLVGSLNGLPYALAEAEQNFMIPTERQALIWQDLAPQILLGATVPRWWNIETAEQHFVGLHLRLGQRLVALAATNAEMKGRLLELLRRRVEPARLWRLQEDLAAGRLREGIAELTPAEIYETAADFGQANAEKAREVGEPFFSAIAELQKSNPSKFNYQRMASIFGTPHPELAQSYKPELLHLPLFPTMMGYSSRILAESWESTNLYWAGLADELHLSPSRLNLLVPEWTQKSLERIFATHLDDWPALLRSMRIVGDRYREQLKPGIEQQVRAGWNDNAKELQ